MAKKKKSKISSVDEAVRDLFSTSDVDEIEADARLVSQEVGLSDLDTCVSSGSLVLDCNLGGGHKAGRIYSYTGPEGAGKTTLVKMAIGEALKLIPHPFKGAYIDGEGTLDTVWAGHIWGVDPKKVYTVFGRKGHDGKYIIQPQIRYYKPHLGERALRYLINLANSKPNKVKMRDQWWYQWEALKAGEAREMGGKSAAEIRDFLTRKVDGKNVKLWSASLFRDTGTFCVPVPGDYGGPEFIVGMDSWSSLTPERTALGDSNAMGQQAAMFSKYLNNLKALIASKGWLIVGTKQIRHKIGGYGDSETNSGGEALKHVDDVRTRVGSISNKIKSQGSDFQRQVEGEDEYRYFNLKNRKNKVGVPFKTGEGRWWTQHNGKSGFGVDPVFDTLEYLKITGQYGTEKGKILIRLRDESTAAKKLLQIPFTYDSFKDSIIYNVIYNIDGEEVSKFNLRSHCFKQIRKGEGLLYFLGGGEDEVYEEEDHENEDD